MRRISWQRNRHLSPAAAALEFVVVWLTITGVLLAGWPNELETADWAAFGILLPIVCTVHLLGAERQKHQGSHLSLAPIFAAVLVLPPALAALVAVPPEGDPMHEAERVLLDALGGIA